MGVETYNINTTTAVVYEYYPLNAGYHDIIHASAPCFFSPRSLKDRMTDTAHLMDGISARKDKYDKSVESKAAEKRARKRHRKKQREREKVAALAAEEQQKARVEETEKEVERRKQLVKPNESLSNHMDELLGQMRMPGGSTKVLEDENSDDSSNSS